MLSVFIFFVRLRCSMDMMTMLGLGRAGAVVVDVVVLLGLAV